MTMSTVLMTICQSILLVGLIKATYSNINDQNVNLIDCSRKKLTSMPVFLQNTTTDLNLSGNYLQGAFAGLTELLYLNLRTNKLTSNSLREKIFKDLISLQDLEIDDTYFHDNYTSFQSEISRIKSLVKLKIDLRGRHQMDKCLCDLSNLKDLEILGLPMKAYSDNSFKKLKCLKIEALSLDKVISLASDTFISFSTLKTLRINIMYRLATYNTISSLFNSFKVFKGKNMTEISISNNPRRNRFVLSHSHFAVLHEVCLQKLNLVGDSILGIQFGPFSRYGYKENCLEELNIDLMFTNKDSYVFAFCAFKHLRIIRIPHVIVRDKRVKRSTENDVSYSFCIPKTLEQLDFHSHVKSYNRRRIANLTIINGSNLKIVNMANITLRDCDGTIY
ncbi:unnamed protein product [Mytilus coruscus]|uniref:Uncharacterized protein n=1 Tax=Mytilus coruscus TaxID=42192 RepID=A0A6J8AMQ4_MYTCO|nr:unnamed protein product [Mytilus coruscus]